MFLVRATNLGFDVVTMSKRRALDAGALLTRRQRLVAPQHHHWRTCSPACLHNVPATNGENTCTVPNLRLPLVGSCPCVVLQGCLHLSVQNGWTLRGCINEDVIPESEKFLAGQQPSGRLLEGRHAGQGRTRLA